MADRNFQKKKRNTNSRRTKPVMVITAEGKNKTEQQYFTSFQNQHGKYSIKFVKTGKETEPAGMYKLMEQYCKNNDISRAYGDKAYIVLDLDRQEHKKRVIDELEGRSENIRFIISNPCIEVWFLMHYAILRISLLTVRNLKKHYGNTLKNIRKIWK